MSSSCGSGAAYLVCLTCNGGVPLFTRKHGDLKQVRNAIRFHHFYGIAEIKALN